MHERGLEQVQGEQLLRLSKAPYVSIASIRGRTRGAGNELALACDLRYASREKALFSQPEVGLGLVPGGGGAERLRRSIGRDRALEAILGSGDCDADLAERWGWVTRTLPDTETRRLRRRDGRPPGLLRLPRTRISSPPSPRSGTP